MFSLSVNVLGLLAIVWWGRLLILLLVLVLIAVVIWWLYRRGPEEAAGPAEAERIAAASVAEAVPPEVRSAPSPADDLMRIEGIGPRISGLLRAAGITTFAQLADTEVSRLREILAEAGLTSLADPSTWPEQASLACAGDWNALEALQDELKGGRRA